MQPRQMLVTQDEVFVHQHPALSAALTSAYLMRIISFKPMDVVVVACMHSRSMLNVVICLTPEWLTLECVIEELN